MVDLTQEVDFCTNDVDLAINPHTWIDAIVRLWDDAQLSRSIEELAYQNARDYASSKTAERIVDFLSQFDKTS